MTFKSTSLNKFLVGSERIKHQKYVMAIFLLIGIIIFSAFSFIGIGGNKEIIDVEKSYLSGAHFESITTQFDTTTINLNDLLNSPENYLEINCSEKILHSRFTIVSSSQFNIPGVPTKFYHITIKDDYDSVAHFISSQNLLSVNEKQLFTLEIRRSLLHKFHLGSVFDNFFMNLLKYKEINDTDAIYIHIFPF